MMERRETAASSWLWLSQPILWIVRNSKRHGFFSLAIHIIIKKQIFWNEFAEGEEGKRKEMSGGDTRWGKVQRSRPEVSAAKRTPTTSLFHRQENSHFAKTGTCVVNVINRVVSWSTGWIMMSTTFEKKKKTLKRYSLLFLAENGQLNQLFMSISITALCRKSPWCFNQCSSVYILAWTSSVF